MRTTIKMIAERSGVSIGTVDRVLHNRPNVKPAVRDHVLSVIKELNYRPNKAASALANSDHIRKIVAIFPSWNTYFHDNIIRGLQEAEEELSIYNYKIEYQIYEQRNHNHCLDILDNIDPEEICGIALCAENSMSVRDTIDKLHDKGIPVVTFNSDISPCKRLCFVGQDPFNSGRIAAEIMGKYLHEQDNILVVLGNHEYSAHQARVDGFCQRMNEIGVTPDRLTIVECYNEYTITLEKVYRILQEHPNIKYIYMANRSVSGCIEALSKLDLLKKVRVITHDVSEDIRSFLQKGYVDFTIDQDILEQGYRPIVTLASHLQSPHTKPREYIYTSSNIINSENIEPLL